MTRRSTRRLMVSGVWATVAALATWAAALLYQSREPRCGNHSLSEWVDAYDTNNRFRDEEPPRSGLTDAQIESALGTIGEKAVPHLLRWAQAKDSPVKLKLNALLDRQRWIRFRFARAIDLHCLAASGFMYYGSTARAAQPTLIKMSLSRDPSLKLMGYEAFYFTLPNKEIFLPVAYRGLKEQDPDIQEMTAQRLVERFPAEAERAGMRSRFPQFYRRDD